MPQVIVVAGPPGSGKTTYVRERIKYGELVVDLDRLGEALSMQPGHQKPNCILPYAKAARAAVYQVLETDQTITRAWIVASVPRRAERDALRRRFNAKVLVLEVPTNECVNRIMRDETRRKDREGWRGLCQRWWDLYEKHAEDEVIRA